MVDFNDLINDAPSTPGGGVRDSMMGGRAGGSRRTAGRTSINFGNAGRNSVMDPFGADRGSAENIDSLLAMIEEAEE